VSPPDGIQSQGQNFTACGNAKECGMSKKMSMVNKWRSSFSPLRRLDMRRAIVLMEQAQRGMMSEVQWLYAAETGIEATDADLMAIIERTVSGVATLDWQISASPKTTHGYDEKLAQEQTAFLRESFNACDNLDDALEHLVMARFRGYAHLQPWLKQDWRLEHLEPLPQWGMLRSEDGRDWAWNPEAKNIDYTSAPNKLNPHEYIVLTNPRPVNRIGLIKYIRSTTAEKDWDAYVEIYGIPGVFIIMPQSVPQAKENEYKAAAEAAAEAGSGALPGGSDIKTLAEARASEPFSMRLKWLQEQLVLAGTGGKLGMLTAPGSGTLAGAAHEKSWQEIVQRVAYLVCRPLNTQYVRRALAARFPGRPCLASFELLARQEKDVGKIVDNIAKLAAAGYRIDPKKVSEEVGYPVTVAMQLPSAVGAFRDTGKPKYDGFAEVAAADFAKEFAMSVMASETERAETIHDAMVKAAAETGDNQ
jgi:phage gp29-like protein